MSTDKASAKIANDIEFIEFEMPDPGVGSTISGRMYVTAHVCPCCSSEMETVGSGHPVFRCSRCGVNMIAKSHEIKDEA